MMSMLDHGGFAWYHSLRLFTLRWCLRSTTNQIEETNCIATFCSNTWEQYMPISIRKAPSRAQRVEVDILPAEWQEYLLS